MAMAARAIVDSGRDQSSWVERRVDDLVDDYDDVPEAVIRQWVESMLATARPGKRS